MPCTGAVSWQIRRPRWTNRSDLHPHSYPTNCCIPVSNLRQWSTGCTRAPACKIAADPRHVEESGPGKRDDGSRAGPRQQADDIGDDNLAPTAPSLAGSRRRSRAGERGCVLRGVRCAPPLAIAQGAGCHCVTAVVTATSSTVPHSNTIRRTPHTLVARPYQGPACIC